MYGTFEPFNFLERYLDLPDNMTNTLMNDLTDANIINLVLPASQIYKLSMPVGLSNKDGKLFFIKLVSHTFLDKEAHKRIIYEYILKLEITESNNMEGFQRELRRCINQYDAIHKEASGRK
jgi:hypothetical protein